MSNLDDVGNRMQHLVDLYDLWMTGLDILERYEQHSPFYKERKSELEAATKLLRFHISKDFKEDAYKNQVNNS